MFSARAPGAVRPVVRCQVRPSGEVQITAWVVPPATASPAARNPSAVLVTTQTWSPGSCGSMPCVAARVQARPFGLVQMACDPIASQPPGPPASSPAVYPSAGCPPPGACTGASCQLAPPVADTKNCWRATPPLACAPTATIVLPEETTRLTVWKTPRACWPAYVPRVAVTRPDCWAPVPVVPFWLDSSGPSFGP